MPVIPEAIIEDVRNRTDIVSVIGDRIPLKRSSGGFVACCPFHHEKTPSFHVNVQRQRYHCFGCGEDGDVFKFLMKHDGMAFVDAVRYLADKCGVTVTMGEDDGRSARTKRLLQVNAEAAAFFHRCLLQTPGAAVARAYLEKRDLSAEIVERFQIGYDPDVRGALDGFARANRFTVQEMVDAGLGALYDDPGPEVRLRDRFHGRLMFPIKDQAGRVVAFSGRILDAAKSPAKYVNSPETEIFKKSRVLYALDQAQRHIASAKNREAIVCEGQIDVIRCHACGFPRAVASEGTAFTPEHARLLHRYADSVVELFDADAAGRKAAVRTAGILLAEGLPVRVASLPAGEDPDSFLRSHPPEDFQKVLDDAVGIIPFHVAFLRDQERDPDGPDAAGRIVQGVLQTVAACQNAVHKARMLQEVARLLNLPEDAVRDELLGVEEALRRQQASAERREAARASAASVSAASSSSAPAPAPAPSASVPVPASSAEGPPPEAFDEPGRDAGSAAVPAAPADPPPDALDVATCEFLLNHCLEEPGTLNALSRLMPATLFPNERVRRILEAFYASVGASTDPVYDLQQADPKIAEFLGAVAARHDRTGTTENYLAKDVAHDLVLRAWRRHLQHRIDNSRKAQGAALDLDRIRERQEANRTLRKLRDWTSGEAVVHVLAGLPPPEGEHLPEPAPDASTAPPPPPFSPPPAPPSALPVPPPAVSDAGAYPVDPDDEDPVPGVEDSSAPYDDLPPDL